MASSCLPAAAYPTHHPCGHVARLPRTYQYSECAVTWDAPFGL